MKKKLKSLTMPKKLKGGTFWDFSTSILSEIIKKLNGGPFGEFFFEKNSHRAKNTPRAPLSFLDDVIILVSKNCKNCKKSGPFRVRLYAEKNYPL